MPFPIGAPQFGVNDAKIAKWLGDGSYGTPVDVMSVRVLSFQLNTVNAQLEGDDQITDTHARLISGTVGLTFGGANSEVLSVILDKTVGSSGTTPNRARTIDITGQNMPYFGLVGKIDSTRGGDMHIFVPMLKVMEGFSLNFTYGEYVIPELTCTAIIDDNFQNADDESVLAYLRWHETRTPITFPPVGIEPVGA